jgi:DNA-binding transcriptional ArsR family regulator
MTYIARMTAYVDIAAAASLIGDPARAAMLVALTEEEAMLSAGELARRARVTAPTASSHLAKLEDGRLVVAERDGRHRYFRIADPNVAAALEALALIASPRPVRSLRESETAAALRRARTCYDHLAGAAGVALLDALVRRRALRRDGDHAFRLSRAGAEFLASHEFDLDAAQRARRAFARPCLDWSERRYHLAGALGAAVTTRLFELGWLKRRTATRAVTITETGRAGLEEVLGAQRLVRSVELS